MTTLLKRLCTALALAMTVAVAAAHAAALTDVQLINLAGQQRMLSQRIVKSWCQIGLNVMPELSKKQLDESIGTFDANMKVLEAQVNNPEARSVLRGLRAAWVPMRAAARGVIRQGDAAQLDARAEDVLMAAERLTRVLQDLSSMPLSRWINLAGRQRMLSQRLVKIYMLRQWWVDNTAMREELERVQHEFAGALASMQQYTDNSTVLREELDNLGLQWEWLRTAIATEGAESYRLIMAEGGEAMLQLAERITHLYEQSPP